MNKFIIPSLALAATMVTTTSAAISLYAEYQLGEPGSLSGTDLIPQDTSGNGYHATTVVNGTTATVETSTPSPDPTSSAYISTPPAGVNGWFGSVLTGLPTDDFAMGVYARTSENSAATDGDIFTTNGAGGFKLSLNSNGWAASEDSIAWIGTPNGIVGSFEADTWTHLALVRKSGTTTFYIDGQAQATYGGEPTHNTLHISANPGGTNGFNGLIDSARIVTFDAADSNAAILNSLQGVPEPSSTALLGLAGLSFIIRRRR